MKSIAMGLLFFLFSSAAQAMDYYISAAGNDSNAVPSSSSPWRTLNKINKLNLAAGDRVFLRGGDTFSGLLALDAADRGSASNPIRITSYGTGKATINGGTGGGIYVSNTAGISISNLRVVGSGATNTSSGIAFYTELAGDIKLDTVKIDGVEATGFRNAGIQIGAWNGLTGFKNVQIINSSVHNNLKNGVFVFGFQSSGFTGLAHQNVYIKNVYAYRNHGISGMSEPTGNGILLSSVDGATIERSVAYENGKNNTHSAGPVGIWAYNANNLKIQYNESYNNRTAE